MTTFITRTVFQSIKSLTQLTKAPKCNHVVVRCASKYKAAAIASKDAKELTFEEKKRPKLKDTQVRIAVAYCSVNIHDINSFNDPLRKFPFVPGYELSGEIIEVGKEAAKLFHKEDRIIALSDDWGGLATECVVDYHDVWTTPACIQLKEAATIPYTYGVALYTFGVLSQIKEDSTVLVAVGPAGGGLAAVDIAANTYKAKVLAVTDTEKNSELTREKGALQTLHYNDNVRKIVTSVFGDRKADIVYDAVGGDVHDIVASSVGDQGKVFILRSEKLLAPNPHASLTCVSLNALRKQNLIDYRQIVQDALELAEQGLIAPHISEQFDFEDVNKAVEFINGKKCHGKVIVKVN